MDKRLSTHGGNQEGHAEEMFLNGIQKDDVKCVRGNRECWSV